MRMSQIDIFLKCFTKLSKSDKIKCVEGIQEWMPSVVYRWPKLLDYISLPDGNFPKIVNFLGKKNGNTMKNPIGQIVLTGG